MAYLPRSSPAKRICIVTCLCAAILHWQLNKTEDAVDSTLLSQLNRTDNSVDRTSASRLHYIRPAGRPQELLDIFEAIKPNSTRLPQTPQQIAQKYGIPQTPRDACNPNGTTAIGWIPNNITDPERMTGIPTNGRIPKVIFQSWYTNELSPQICNNIAKWHRMNPDYDYFLFDDAAIDRFVQLEYGSEIFSSFACVKVGAAMCDVWRLLVIYLFGGVYFDADVRLNVPLREWNWGNRSVVTPRSCTSAPRKHPGGCAHQWGLIYEPYHLVMYDSIRETLTNLANRQATHVYDVSFWAFYHGWRNGPYNQSYMPGWGEEMGGRVKFYDPEAKEDMTEENGSWGKAKQIWHDECIHQTENSTIN